MTRIVLAYTLGFVVAEYWTLWLFRSVFDAPGLVALHLGRFVASSVIEAAFALAALVAGLQLARASWIKPTRLAMAAFLVAGLVAGTLTVSASPLVQRILEGDPRLLFQALAASALSLAMALGLSAAFRK